ncbi:MAG: hypothetical protein PWQ57_832 [Desulfovibrionales bacterium]|jgi:uncharacterized alpha-E superfamily protein|nr:hypothetical protein [Desulfovibrionales bacterium]
MLSRVAESVYWMSRYLERAENTARFLDVNWRLMLDSPAPEQEQWQPLVMVSGDQRAFFKAYDEASRENVVHFLTFDANNPNSIISCLMNARENARCIREIIPTEMWEITNTFYHDMAQASRRPNDVADNPFDFCTNVKSRGLLLSGVSADAMAHDEVWDFFRMGKLLERADKTSRILDVKYFTLLPKDAEVGSTLDYVQWTALLKAASGLQAYRRREGRIYPIAIVKFLMLDHEFPRAVLYCLAEAQDRLHAITGNRIGHFGNPAEKQLGLLCSELSYLAVEDIFSRGLHEFTDSLQVRMNNVDNAVYETFFATYPAIDAGLEQ